MFVLVPLINFDLGAFYEQSYMMFSKKSRVILRMYMMKCMKMFYA